MTPWDDSRSADGGPEGRCRSQTWILFESGAGAEVDVSFYTPGPGASRPVDAYVVTEADGDLTRAARRAAEAVYALKPGAGGTQEPLIVGFELQGLPTERAVAGASGGLAFAVALAKAIHRGDPGPVAATGEIRGSYGGGPVGPVEGIAAKLQAALERVPEGGWVLFPRENQESVPQPLLSDMAAKGLHVRPVASVAEALDHLFPGWGAPEGPFAGKDRNSHRCIMPAAALVILLGLATMLCWIHQWWPFSHRPSPEPSAVGESARRPPDNPLPRPVSESARRPAQSPEPGQKAPGISSKTHPKSATREPGIFIKGSSLLAARMAEQSAARLKSLLLQRSSEMNAPSPLKARIRVIRVSETPEEPPQTPHCRLIVGISNIEVATENGSETHPPIRVEVEAPGTLDDLLPEAADRVAEALLAIATTPATAAAPASPTPPEKESPRPYQGFE